MPVGRYAMRSSRCAWRSGIPRDIQHGSDPGGPGRPGVFFFPTARNRILNNPLTRYHTPSTSQTPRTQELTLSGLRNRTGFTWIEHD